MKSIHQIECPECHHEFHLEEGLQSKLEAKIRQELETQRKVREKELEKREAEISTLEKSLKSQLEEQAEKVEELAKAKAKEKEAEYRQKLQAELREELQVEMESLQQKSGKQSAEIRKMKQKQIQLLEEKEAFREQKEEMELEVKRQLLEGKQKVAAEERRKVLEEVELQKQEMQKELSDVRKQLDVARQKTVQSSQKLTGEVQELALEELLKAEFPLDKVEEIRSGKRGADVVQGVIFKGIKECGSILYESKSTQQFQATWIPKVKEDMLRQQAAIAVIVTKTLPNGMHRFGLCEGVWICTFEEVPSMALVLREMLIKVASARTAEENKGDKMVMLYEYLTSPEFVQQVHNVMDGFKDLDQQLESERRQFEIQWKKREKMHKRITRNLLGVFGSVQGIAGADVGDLNLLGDGEN